MFNKIREIFLTQDNARALIEAFEKGNYRMNTYEDFETKISKDILGNSSIKDPFSCLDYWSATIYCRYKSQCLNDTVINQIRTFVSDPSFSGDLDKHYPLNGSMLVNDFFKVIVKNYDFNQLPKKRLELAKRNANGNNSWAVGDIFLFELGDTVISGLILGEVKKMLKGKKSDPWTNKLFNYKDFYLISVSRVGTNVSDKDFVIQGGLATSDAFKNGLFKKEGKLKISAEDIDFPEYLDEGHFIKGELRIPLSPPIGSFADLVEEYNQVGLNSFFLDQYALYLSGQKERISFYPEYDRFFNQEWRDLRFNSAKREKIYQLIKEDMKIGYIDLAKKHGIDTSNYLK